MTLPVKLSPYKFCMSASFTTAPDTPISVMKVSGPLVWPPVNNSYCPLNSVKLDHRIYGHAVVYRGAPGNKVGNW